jgi:hypothetical protein
MLSARSIGRGTSDPRYGAPFLTREMRSSWLTIFVPTERQAAYLYEVPGENDPRAALEAVKAGKAVILDRSLTTDEILKRSGL